MIRTVPKGGYSVFTVDDEFKKLVETAAHKRGCTSQEFLKIAVTQYLQMEKKTN